MFIEVLAWESSLMVNEIVLSPPFRDLACPFSLIGRDVKDRVFVIEMAVCS